MPKPTAKTGSTSFSGPAIFSVLFILLIFIPFCLGAIGSGSHPQGGGDHKKAPILQVQALLAPDYYQAWGAFLSDRFAGLNFLARGKSWVDYHLFNMTDNHNIHVGRDGWLFSQQAIADMRQGACDQAPYIRQLMIKLETISHLVEKSGRRFVFSIAPDKTTIHPEHLGNGVSGTECQKTLYDLFLEAHGRNPLACFMRLDELLKSTEPEQGKYYTKTGSIWNDQGAMTAARSLLDAIFQNGDEWENSGDLSAALMGKTSSIDHGVLNNRFKLSSAAIYGGVSIRRLLPYLSWPFNRMDTIVTDTIPSPNHGESLADYDAVVVVIDESQLGKVQFDFDRLCRMLKVDSLADEINSIPLKTLSAESKLSIEHLDNQISIKSLGLNAFFRLPALPGSDADTLRILAFDIVSSSADRLSWQISNGTENSGTKPLRSGSNHIYLPLPSAPSVLIHINPGETTGLFSVSEAKLIAFAEGLTERPLIAAAGNDYYAVPKPGDGSASSVQANTNNRNDPDNSTVLSISLNDYEDFQIIQRNGTNADIIISGTYTGDAAGVEARVLRYGDASPVTPWRPIDSAPANGVFMGILSEVPQGGWYRLAVRVSNHPEVSDSGKARWGIGLLVGFIGQSNMAEWFHAGEDLKPHALLALNRENAWSAIGENGNGAISFGNRLIAKLGIPVGLLDYAVNGSGLRKEADWGAGYWSDKSEGSIYHRFIKGVASTGGKLEYVVWMQGEADAARGTITGNQYRNALASFIEQQIREDITNASPLPHLPFLVIGMVKRPIGKDGPHQAIRDAQSKAVEEVPNAYLAATTLDLQNLGRQHLAPEAYTSLGLRVAQTVLYLLGEEDYYRGPSIVGGRWVDSGTIDVFMAHRGGSDFRPAVKISGWQALSGGETVTIAGVRRINDRTVRIQFEAPVEGPVTLRYLYGAMPDADRAIHDNSAMELPLEQAEIEVK